MLNKEKYALVYTHKGIDIYTLKIADPTKDEMGYRIDSPHIKGEFCTVGEALDTIDVFSGGEEND